MVQFRYTLDGYEVLVDGQRFGYITREHGFFTSPSTIIVPLTVTSNDLIVIAKKVEDVRARDRAPDHLCRKCGGTPNFPKQICSSNIDAMKCCVHPIHGNKVR